MSNFSLNKLQEEQKPWVLHNFGERPKTQPLRGIVEEFGELSEAISGLSISTNRKEDIADCLADFIIFSSDYCSAKEWSLQEIYDSSECKSFAWKNKSAWQILIQLGKLNHADLKSEQKIRVNENHELEGKAALAKLISIAKHIALDTELDLLDEVEKTWNSVSKRDFKKYPKTGLPDKIDIVESSSKSSSDKIKAIFDEFNNDDDRDLDTTKS